jgi:hypothetical protein
MCERAEVDEHGRTWTNMDEHGRTWTNMDEHGRLTVLRLLFKCNFVWTGGSDRIQAGQRSRGSPATGGTGWIGGRGRLIFCKPTLAMEQLLLLSQRKVNLITISVKQFFLAVSSGLRNVQQSER